MLKNNFDNIFEFVNKNKYIFIILIMGIILLAISIKDNYEIQDNLNTIEQKEEMKNIAEDIIVHVDGAVNSVGVYSLKKGDRLIDAIEKAGDTRENADMKNINLAKKLNDGEKIYIPFLGENISNQEENDTNIGKINLNSATSIQLDSLPGIGVSTAKKIIDYREKNGSFESIEDLKNVAGIGESKYDSLKELIEV